MQFEFVGVVASKRVAMLADPGGQRGLARGGPVGVREAVGHGTVFVLRQQYVVKKPADAGAEDWNECTWDVDDSSPARDFTSDELNELEKGRPFRADGIHDRVFASNTRVDAELSKILDVDRTDPVVTSTTDGEDRKVPKQPGDVGEQHVMVAEQHCGPEHCVGKTALGQSTFDDCLPAKVRVGRIDRRMRDADVHDSFHAGAASSDEQRAAVGAREVVGGGPVWEAHPIGVVERGHSAQVDLEACGVGEIERSDIDK